MLGEPVHDVAPGHLPRSLHELRASAAQAVLGETSASGTANSPAIQDGALSPQSAEVPPGVSESAPSSQDLTQDRNGTGLSETSSTSMSAPHAERRALSNRPREQANDPDRARQAEYQARRIVALRRELQRMRTGIERVMSGLQELGEHLPESQDAVRRSTNVDHRLEAIQNRLGGTANDDSAMDAQVSNTQQSLDSPSNRVSAVQQLAIDDSQVNTTLPSSGENAISTLDRQLSLAVADLEQARRSYDEASQARQACENEVRAASARVRRLEREKQILEQNTRIFGSREEVERQGPDYESPIANMFNRAYSWRARAQEEERRQRQHSTEIVEAINHGTEVTLDVDRTLEANPAPTYPFGVDFADYSMDLRDEDVGRNQDRLQAERGSPLSMRSRLYAAIHERRLHDEHQAELAQQPWDRIGNSIALPHRLPLVAPQLNNAWQFGSPVGRGERSRRAHWAVDEEGGIPTVEIGDEDDESDLEEEIKGLDDDDGRPAPKSDEEMTLMMECKVCYSQIADIAVIPCGHLVMCEVRYY